jgi:hypothetical protein
MAVRLTLDGHWNPIAAGPILEPKQDPQAVDLLI